jgi:hypothetical protein
MNSDRPTTTHLLPVFIAMAVFLLAAFQHPGEGQFILNPPTPEPLCDCPADLFDCSDFRTQFEAQQCFDSCWVLLGVSAILGWIVLPIVVMVRVLGW